MDPTQILLDKVFSDDVTNKAQDGKQEIQAESKGATANQVGKKIRIARKFCLTKETELR